MSENAMDSDISDLEFTILRALRDATSTGLIRWERSKLDEDHYFTTCGPLSSFIQFKWVSFNGDHGSDRDFVEVGGAGHRMAGTRGWWLVTEILAAGNVAYWRDHNQRIRESYQRSIETLQKAIGAE
jgi:hypothetical protein